MKNSVTVIDYGIGNLLKISRALAAVGGEVTVTSSPDIVACAERLILPGVGSFPHGMEGLRSYNLFDALAQFQRSERPFMGICLGMQMMLSKSDEFSSCQGLGMIPGRVQLITKTTADGHAHKIPLMGWMELKVSQSAGWRNSPLRSVKPGASAYFAHSYAAVPDDASHHLAEINYNGRQICAAIAKDNLFGCQFHPEMSSDVGLQILRDFMGISQPLKKLVASRYSD